MRRSPTPYQSLLSDTNVMNEVQESITSKRKIKPLDELIERVNETVASARGKAFDIDRKAIVEFVNRPATIEGRMDSNDRLPEAIVLFQGRPSLLIQKGDYVTPSIQAWAERLDPHRAKLKKAISAVGRIEVIGHPDFTWLGTGYVVDERVVVTNRHVASLFAQKQGGTFTFVKNPFGDKVGVKIDFREEFQGTEPFEVEVENVIYMADNLPNAPDMALLLLKSHDKLPDPFEFESKEVSVHDPIAVIGYPAHDSRNDGVIMSQIFSNIFDVKRLAPGEVSFNENGMTFEHDCTTLGGNSGSPVLNYESGKVVGLHYSGRFGVANFAIKSNIVKNQLAGRVFGSTSVPQEERRTAADYENREGYQEDFLGDRSKDRVPLPELNSDQLMDAVEVRARGRGIAKYVLDYTHFSLVMCKSRRTAYYTAVNIDGNEEIVIRRKNTTWLIDPRIPQDSQVGNDFYANNNIDRGHLVRRMDPVWGADDVAKQAEMDSFHYTNAAPQHANLNQREWLKLEDYLLNNANRRDLKISVFTGPVFRESDVKYRNVGIPEEFWKVVAMIAPDGKLHATGYLLSQRQFLDDIEFVFGRFKTYQTSIQNIETLSGLSFGGLRRHDPLEGPESSLGSPQPIRPLDGLESIVL